MVIGLKDNVVELADHEKESEIITSETTGWLYRILMDLLVDKIGQDERIIIFTAPVITKYTYPFI